MFEFILKGGFHMDFNTILRCFGFEPEDFVDEPLCPIKADFGYIIEVKQKSDCRLCPHCGSFSVVIKDHRFVEYNISNHSNDFKTLRVRKTRFYCKDCHKSFTNPINGITPKTKFIEHNKQLLLSDFTKMISFSEIAASYKVTPMRIIQLFDSLVPYVPRRQLTKEICIDEVKFKDNSEGKYICVLSDFKNGDCLDVISNRRMDYLDDYFSKIPPGEAKQVKVFISDMYDGYATVKRKYFPSAIHIIDLFHIIRQLSRAVNRLRTRAMNLRKQQFGESDLYYKFMKNKWEKFLCKKSKLYDKTYSPKGNEEMSCFDLVQECISLDMDLWDGYNMLQELFRYHYYSTFDEANNFINRVINKLRAGSNEILEDVANTYEKWKVGIINAFTTRYDRNRSYTNGVAEGNNNAVTSLIKIAYGYGSFERFRKRILLIKTYKKVDV